MRNRLFLSISIFEDTPPIGCIPHFVIRPQVARPEDCAIRNSEWEIRKTGLNGVRLTAERISIRVHSRDSRAKKGRPANYANRHE